MTTEQSFLFMEHIPFLKEKGMKITPIYKGYSNDCKYVVDGGASKYLLRTYDLSHAETKQIEYEALKSMERQQVSCSRPLEIGTIEPLNLGYMLLTYIEGEDASEALPACNTTQQYNIGLEAGQQLRLIHQLQAPSNIASWHDRKLAKHGRYIEAYKKLGISIKGDTKIMSFIDTHIELMQDRPNLFQHDDFHVGNLIVQEQKQSGVIDFNRFDWGDPVHEFLKAGMFSSEVSIPFSIGQIRGYHHMKDPDEPFWSLYSLYMAMSMIASVVWISKVKSDETDSMLERIDRIIADHHYFDEVKPNWYNNENI